MGISCSDGEIILTATTPPHFNPKPTLGPPQSNTLDKLASNHQRQHTKKLHVFTIAIISQN